MRAIGSKRVTPLSGLPSTSVIPQPLSSPITATLSPASPPPAPLPLAPQAPSPPMEPRRYGGKVGWTPNDDQLLLSAHSERSAVVFEQEPEARGGKGPRLTAVDWDAIAEEVKNKGGNARSGGAHKARWKIIESGGRNKGEKQGSELGARSRKRSVDDAYDWYEEVTPSKRRASVGSASTTASEGIASATRSFSNAGIEQKKDPDYSPPSLDRRASSPTTFMQEDTLSKRPWQPTEDSLLIALKTGATTKRYSYAQLVEHFPGRGAASIAARWGKIKGRTETRKEIGANKRRARDDARDRTIQATLTGPPRLTWVVFEKRMREREGMDIELAEESDEDGEDEETCPSTVEVYTLPAPQQAQPQSRPTYLVTRIDQLLNKDDVEEVSLLTFEADRAPPSLAPTQPQPSPREPAWAPTATAHRAPYSRPFPDPRSAPNASTNLQKFHPPLAAPYSYCLPFSTTPKYHSPSFTAVAPFPVSPAPPPRFPAPSPNPPVWPSLPRLAREGGQGSQTAPERYIQGCSSGGAATKPLIRREAPTFTEVWTGRAGLK